MTPLIECFLLLPRKSWNNALLNGHIVKVSTGFISEICGRMLIQIKSIAMQKIIN